MRGRRWKALIRALLPAVLLVLAYPPADVGLLGLAALIPWLTALDGASPRAAWRFSYLVGLLFFAGTLWFLVYVTAIGGLVLVAYLALYFAVFGVIAAWVLCRPPVTWRTPIVLASAWTLLEALCGTLFTGFGLTNLGHTQWRGPLLQLADLVGIYGVTWLVAWVNVSLWQAWVRRAWQPVVIVTVVLVGAVTYGVARRELVERAVAKNPTTGIALVQGNIPQSQKWDAASYRMIAQRYAELTHQAEQGSPALIIWPETAVPGFPAQPEVHTWLEALAKGTGAGLLVGTPWAEEQGEKIELYNSALLVGADGTFLDRYDKVHLVPFGEFIPGEVWWPTLGRLRDLVPIGEFSPGHRWTVFAPVAAAAGSRTTALWPAAGAVPPFSVLICFEDLFPAISRAMVRAGARMLVTITNDAWFGPTAAPIQHAQTSVFRAVEHRVWMLRAGNTGYTCAINPAGQIVTDLRGPRGELGVAGVCAASVSTTSLPRTPYTRFGDWWLLVCAAALLLLMNRKAPPSKH